MKWGLRRWLSCLTAFEIVTDPISVLTIRASLLTEARFLDEVVPSDILETKMSKSLKITGRSFMLGCTSLLLTAFPGQAMAQDYSVKIKRAADVSVDVEYESINNQINKYCRKQSLLDGRMPLPTKAKIIDACHAELIENFLTQADDRRLIAYHRDLKSGKVMMAENTKTTKETG